VPRQSVAAGLAVTALGDAEPGLSQQAIDGTASDTETLGDRRRSHLDRQSLDLRRIDADRSSLVLALRAELLQNRPFMHGDMLRLIAFNFVLWLIFGGMMDVPLVIHILRMDPDDPAADPPGLGIPAHVIAAFESFPMSFLQRGLAQDGSLSTM
jgi:hypothetical protein